MRVRSVSRTQQYTVSNDVLTRLTMRVRSISRTQQYTASNNVLTLFSHAGISTSQQTTRLTLATHPHVHLTTTSVLAHILRITSDAATEKTYITNNNRNNLPDKLRQWDIGFGQFRRLLKTYCVSWRLWCIVTFCLSVLCISNLTYFTYLLTYGLLHNDTDRMDEEFKQSWL